jgi:hypothetical protein
MQETIRESKCLVNAVTVQMVFKFPVMRLHVQVTASKRSEDIFRIAEYPGVAPDFVQMRAWGGV